MRSRFYFPFQIDANLGALFLRKLITSLKQTYITINTETLCLYPSFTRGYSEEYELYRSMPPRLCAARDTSRPQLAPHSEVWWAINETFELKLIQADYRPVKEWVTNNCQTFLCQRITFILSNNLSTLLPFDNNFLNNYLSSLWSSRI